jgi:hypothetical protein
MAETKPDNIARHVSSAKTQNAPIELGSPEASDEPTTAMPTRNAMRIPNTGRDMERMPKTGHLSADIALRELS